MRFRVPSSIVFFVPLAAFLTMGFGPSAAQAASFTWNNASGGNWDVPGNWAPPGVPGAGDEALITLDGTYTVTLNVNVSLDSLVVGAASGTQTLSMTVAHTLTLSSNSRVTANGVLNFTTATIGGTGTLFHQGLATFGGSTLNGPFTNQGTLILHGVCPINGALGTATGSTLRLEGNGSVGSSVATVATGFTNNGTIELTGTSASFGATLAVTAGTLVNAAGHAINVLAGSGGARTLTAQLDNQGTLSVQQALTINKSAVQHQNSGLVDVSGGNLTLTQSGAIPSFTNTPAGTVNIAAGRTLAMSGGTYVHDGTMNGPGLLSFTNAVAILNVNLSNAAADLAFNASTVNGPDSLVNAGGRTLALVATTVNAPLSNRGILIARGSCPTTGALVTAISSTLRIEGNGAQGTGTVTVANGFTSNGTIELTSTNASFGATLAVTAGTLVNPPGHAINVLAGSGGARTLTARLDNQGTLSVQQTLTINKSAAQHQNSGLVDVSGGNLALTQSGLTPSFTNTPAGTVNIASGQTLTVSGGTYVHDGTLNGPGLLSFTNAAATLNVNLSNATVDLAFNGGTVNGPDSLVNAGGHTLAMLGTMVNAPLSNRGTLIARASCPINGALVTAPSSTLRMEGNGTQGAGTVTVATGFTNNGTIELISISPTFGATLAVTSGTLVNASGQAINVLAGSGGTRTLTARLDNQGTLSVQQALTINKSAVQHQNSGLVDVSGGNLTLTQSGAIPSFTNTPAGTVNIAAGRTLAVNGGTYVHDGTLNGPGLLSFANAVATLNLKLSNAGVDLSFSASTVNGPDSLVNAGGRTLALVGTTVNAPLSNRGTLIANGSCPINGALVTAISSTLRMEGNPQGTGTVTVANGFTSNGTIELTSTNASFGATLAVTAGTLVNAAGQAINVLAGSGGARTLTALLDNQGTLSVQQALTINKSSSQHQNSGLVDVSGGNLTLAQTGTTPSFTNANGGIVSIGSGQALTVSGGTIQNALGGVIRGSGTLTVSSTTFTNSGTIAPGNSAGILTITGNVAQDATATLEIEIGGAAPGAYDRLAVSGSFPITGQLHVSLINGFVPTPGQSFQVLTRSPGSGLFQQITGLALGGGLSLEPHYASATFSLLTVAQTWVKLIPNTAPPLARNGHAAVYDPTNNRMIVFGGQGDAGVLNDVWVLTKADGTAGTPDWIKLSPTGGPPSARANHGAAYDAANNRLMIFGGDDASSATPALFGDVWVLTNANGLGGPAAWSSLATTGGPPAARTGASVVYDASTNALVMFGGDVSAGTCGGVRNDVWVLANANGLGGAATWTALAPSGGPPSARSGHQAMYDAANNQMIVFGGGDPCGTSNNEVWELSAANGVGSPAWAQLSPGGSTPAPWAGQRAVYDASTNRMTVFGGAVSGARTDTVLTLAAANGIAGTPAWSDLTPTAGPPLPRTFHSAVQAGGRMIAFAGLSDGGRLNDVWVLEQLQGRVLDAPPVIPPAPVARITGFSRPMAPNPARAAVSFAVSVTERQPVDISAWDIAGRRVATIFHGVMEPGERAFTWDGMGARGARIAPGLYLVRFDGSRVRQTRRFVWLE